MAAATMTRLGTLVACALKGAQASGKDTPMVRDALLDVAMKIHEAQSAVTPGGLEGTRSELRAQTTWAMKNATAADCLQAGREARGFFPSSAPAKTRTMATLLAEAADLGANALRRGWASPEEAAPQRELGTVVDASSRFRRGPSEARQLLERGYGDGGPTTLAEADAVEAAQARDMARGQLTGSTVRPESPMYGVPSMRAEDQRAAERRAEIAAAIEAFQRGPQVQMAPKVPGIKAYKPPPLETREISQMFGKYGTPEFQTVKSQIEDYDRTTAVNRVKKALRARTGLAWSVTNSKSREGLEIEAPKDRKTCFRDGRAVVSQREIRRWWKEHAYNGSTPPTEQEIEGLFTSTCNSDRKLLADALGYGAQDYGREWIMRHGGYDCWGYGCRAATVAMAEGRVPTVEVRKYDYD